MDIQEDFRSRSSGSSRSSGMRSSPGMRGSGMRSSPGRNYVSRSGPRFGNTRVVRSPAGDRSSWPRRRLDRGTWRWWWHNRYPSYYTYYSWPSYYWDFYYDDYWYYTNNDVYYQTLFDTIYPYQLTGSNTDYEPKLSEEQFMQMQQAMQEIISKEEQDSTHWWSGYEKWFIILLILVVILLLLNRQFSS